MTRVTEHLSKEEIEEKIAVLVRAHHAADPRISAIVTELRTSWLMALFISGATAGFALAVLLRG